MIYVSYLLIGIIAGFLAGFWLRHQFEFIRIRENSIFSHKPVAQKAENNEIDKEKSGMKIPVRKDRFNTHFKHSGKDV